MKFDCFRKTGPKIFYAILQCSKNCYENLIGPLQLGTGMRLGTSDLTGESGITFKIMVMATYMVKGIVKRGEPCKCDILLVSRIL